MAASSTVTTNITIGGGGDPPGTVVSATAIPSAPPLREWRYVAATPIMQPLAGEANNVDVQVH